MALPRAAQAQGTCQGSLAASASSAPALAKYVPAAERSGVVFHGWLDPNRPAAHLIVENTNTYPVAVSFQAELRGASGPVSSPTRCVWVAAGEFVQDVPGVTVFEYPGTLSAVRIGSAQVARLDPPRPAADTPRPRAVVERAGPVRPTTRRPDPDSLRAARRAAAARDSLRAFRRAAARRDSVADARRVAARRDSVADARRTRARRDSIAEARRVAARRDSVADARRASERRDSVAEARRLARRDSAAARIAARRDTTPIAAPDSARVIATAQPMPRDTPAAVAVVRDTAPRVETVPRAERVMPRPARRQGPPPSAIQAATMFSVAAGALLVPAGVVLGIAVGGAAFLLGGLVPWGAVRRAAARLRRRG
ncbi:MAG: hypothetical protein ICV87_00670 [Gemmatimonadetes bacterium]|nr:hypothetical protein [Gemmatimonadota bacterium]